MPGDERLARILSRAQVGLAAPLVQIEVHLGAGLPCFHIVGLPAPVVREAKERVRAALVNSGFEFPAGRITVNLAPAELPKEGGRFDLPIALGVLRASGQLRWPEEHRGEFYGELGLGGELKPVPGLLPAAVQAAHAGHLLYLPHANSREAQLAKHRAARPAHDLVEVCALIEGRAVATPDPDDAQPGGFPGAMHSASWDDVQGQYLVKRALTIAAAGEHSVLMIGPPGCGKSMLAQCLPALLPDLDETQALEVAAVASLDVQGFDVRRWRKRPFRTPHHTASASAMIGGGRDARPGELSLAHHGVLFLDELPEFDRRVLESLREPLESRSVSIARAAFRVDYPARFQLVAAMNPCPCGYHGSEQRACRCALDQLGRYRSRVSGPLLDRIDMRLMMAVPVAKQLESGKASPRLPFSEARQRVFAARKKALQRAGRLNAFLTVAELAGIRMNGAATELIETARASGKISMRAIHRAMRVAQTIADLEQSDIVTKAQLAEAMSLRNLPAEWS